MAMLQAKMRNLDRQLLEQLTDDGLPPPSDPGMPPDSPGLPPPDSPGPPAWTITRAGSGRLDAGRDVKRMDQDGALGSDTLIPRSGSGRLDAGLSKRIGDLDKPGSTGGSTGGTGGTGSGGNLAEAAARAAANGYTDIDGAGNLRSGSHRTEGFNTNGWGTQARGTNTMKNTFGKIASRYDPTQAGAARAVMNDPDFQALWPGAVLIDHPNGDMIDFDGNGPMAPVDVLRAARAGGAVEAWQWGVQDGSGADTKAPPGGAGAGGATRPPPEWTPMGAVADPMAIIQQQIQELAGGQDSQIQDLIQQILSGQRSV